MSLQSTIQYQVLSSPKNIQKNKALSKKHAY